MNDFGTFTKIAKHVGDLGKIIIATGFEVGQSAKKLLNLVTLHRRCLQSA